MLIFLVRLVLCNQTQDDCVGCSATPPSVNWAVSLDAESGICDASLVARQFYIRRLDRVLQLFSYLAPGLPVGVIESLIFMILVMMYI